MSETAVAKTVQKLTSVWKTKKSANIGKKKQGAKNPNQEIEDIRKRRNLYMEIFSESNDVLKQALVKSSEWLLTFLQDALAECKSGDSAPYITQLSKAFSECNFLPSKAVAEEIEKNLQDMVDSVMEIINGPKLTPLKKYPAESGVLAIQIWAFVIKILSKQIVTCSDTTNLVCSVFAQGFKSSKVPIVQQSFSSWRALVEAFQQIRVASNDKRLELVLRALRHKVTPVASMEIFETWLFLAESLGGRLPLLFEQVIHGLLRFCVGGETQYFPLCTDEAEVEEMISKPMSPGCQLVSMMSQNLHLIKYSRAIVNIVPELIPKLHLLLDALLSNDGIFATAFYQSEVVQLYTTYLLQCIRWVSFNVPSDGDIALSLPSLWLSVSGRINGVLGDEILKREKTRFLMQLHAWVGESKHGNKLANETIALLQSAGAFSGFESKHEELQELLNEVSKDATPSALSLEQLDMAAKSSGSSLLSSIVDQIFNDTTLPLSSSDLNEADAVKLVPTVSIGEGSLGAISESIGMSNRSVEEVMQSFSTPPSSTANTGRMKKSVEGVKALATKTSVNAENGQKEYDGSREITMKNEKVANEGAVAEGSTYRVASETAKDVQNSPEIIEETPDEQVAAYSSSINQTVSIGSRSTACLSPTISNSSEIRSDVSMAEAAMEKENSFVNLSAPAENILKAPFVVTASTVYATPKSARSSGFANQPETPGILRKIGSPINSDKKKLRVHFVPDGIEGAVKSVADQASLQSSKSVHKVSLANEKAESLVQSRKRLHLPAKDGIGVTEKDASAQLQELDKSPPEKSLNTAVALYSPVVKKNKLNSVLAPVLRAPFMPELVENEETIVQLCRSLAPGSNSTLVMHLHNKKILTVGAFASLSENEILALPIKMPQKLEKIREVMAKMYLGLVETPFHIQSAPTAESFVVDPNDGTAISSAVDASSCGLTVDVRPLSFEVEAAAMDTVEKVHEVKVVSDKAASFSDYIKNSWKFLKTALAWVDDPSVVIQQKSALEMIMAMNECSNEVSKRMHQSISNDENN